MAGGSEAAPDALAHGRSARRLFDFQSTFAAESHMTQDTMTQELWNKVDTYLNDLLVPSDPVLEAALAASAAAGLPEIQVAPNQGKLLNLLARSQGARTILEIGTLAAYSSTWLARALPKEGRLITLEFEPKHAEVARTNLARAGLDDRVEVRVGKAIDLLAKIAAERRVPFDLTFIDA